jgi:DNA-binding NarL/FixJ family response regulator
LPGGDLSEITLNKDKIKIVIADDNLMVLKGIRNLLERAPNMVVLGEAQNGKEAIHLIETLSPDILILDISMPVMDGLTAMRLLRQKGCEVPVIILSGNNDFDTVAESIKYGAHSYILKEDAPENILKAINKAFRGEVGNVSLGISKNNKPL